MQVYNILTTSLLKIPVLQLNTSGEGLTVAMKNNLLFL